MTAFALLALLAAAPAAQAAPPAGAPATQAKPALDVSKLPFTADSIRQVVSSHMDQIQQCYEDMLASTGKPLKGSLHTAFKITPQGVVKGARVLRKGTTLRDPQLHQCVVTVLSAMDFPKPPENRDYPVEYPFNLKPVR
jgi:hypothetical protein